MSLNVPRTSNDSIEQIPRYEEDAFTILERIASGGQATVYKGNFRKTPMEFLLNRPSRLVAMRKYHIAISMDTSKELREIEILIKANNKHPRIVQLLGITIDKYEETKFSGYIMEYMQNGSLDRVIHDKSINYDLDQIYSWLQQAASGIMYLHEQNIIHRDIKPSNLLLGNTLNDLKVADFGHARHTSEEESSITRGIGTNGYTAPEVFTTGKYNNAADVYSFTITIWEIFHRKKPLDGFSNIAKHRLTKKVINGWHPTIEFSCIEPRMKHLLERGWRKDPLQRITFKEILNAVHNHKKLIYFLNLLPERKRVMAKLMAEKNDTFSLDRLINGEGQEFMTVYEAWKASKDDSGPQEASSTGTSTKNETVQNMPDVPPEVFEKLPKEMTVVFLGETGVGKSTFINGLVNYLKYATFHEAQQKGVEILIKAYFTLLDCDFNRLEINCEPTIKVEKSAEVGNEDTNAGQPCAQFPKSYKFVWSYGGEERVIRIIDTPGVGDVRGVGKEKENFHQILSFLANFKKINAICILLKPNEARRTIGFRYCVIELLRHLHVSAARNILFCFTNARQTLYSPGETLGALESYLAPLREEKQIDIPLNKETMFYFDNEAFRFLCALNKGAKFNAKEVENFNGSWIRTVAETFRLFGRIAELDAHDVEKTLSVNNIRSVILGLSRPLAEIARNQLLNARLIDDKTNEIQRRIDEGKDL